MATARKTTVKAKKRAPKNPVRGSASVAARRAHNPEVVGSTPTPATKSTAGVAQPVVQRPRKSKVGSSNPPASTNPGAGDSTRSNAKVGKPDVKVFIAEYKIDRNGRRAAIAAGYSAASADSTASRLLRSAKVKAEVEQHRADAIAKVQAETGITLERTLREIARIGYFDPRKMFNKDGEPLPITELDDDTAAAVAGLDVLEEFEGHGEDRKLVGHVKKWKIAEKKGALDMLMRHLGGYAEDNHQNANALADLLGRLGRSAIPVVRDTGETRS